jgi:molybdopterin/thiamine biosynthesis adenylyltransferase
VAAEISEHELERYARQVERIGLDGQQRLKAARVLVLGARAAGSAAAAQLVSSGVGYVAIVDGGAVEAADLCAQAVLYTPDVGANRAEAVAAKLGILNTHTQAESYPVDVEEANAHAILVGHDVAIDCRHGGVSLEDHARTTGVAVLTAPGGRAVDGLLIADEALSLLATAAPVTQGAPA